VIARADRRAAQAIVAHSLNLAQGVGDAIAGMAERSVHN
jgi:hypothetical protein